VLADERDILTQAERLFAQRQFLEVVELLSAWLPEHSDSACAWGLLGKAHFGLGQWAEAEAATGQFARLKPGSARAWCNWGVALRNVGRLREAREAQGRALGIASSYAHAQAELREIDRAEGRAAGSQSEGGSQAPEVEKERNPSDMADPGPRSGSDSSSSGPPDDGRETARAPEVGRTDKCIACGADMPAPGLRFCPHCGGALAKPQAPRPRTANKSGCTGWRGVWLAVVLVVASRLLWPDAWGRLRERVTGVLSSTPSAQTGYETDGAVPVLPEERVVVRVVAPGRTDCIGQDFAAFRPASGNVFWYCILKVVNTGTNPHHANPNNVSLITTDGQTFSYSSVTHALTGHDFPAVNLQPGNNAAGIIVFEIPEDSKPKTLVYQPMLGPPVEHDF